MKIARNETTKKKSRTKGNEEKDNDAEEKPPHMKRSASMLRFDKWNVGDRYVYTSVRTG